MNFEMRFRGFVSSRVRLETTVPITKSRDPENLDWYRYSIQPYYSKVYFIPDAGCDLLIYIYIYFELQATPTY